MGDIVKQAVSMITTALITFGYVCLGVLLFAIQFGFDWSFLLCVCVWMALYGVKWLFMRSAE